MIKQEKGKNRQRKCIMEEPLTSMIKFLDVVSLSLSKGNFAGDGDGDIVSGLTRLFEGILSN